MAEKRALIWAAVSTREQDKEGKYSLEAQQRDGAIVCERMGWQVVDTLVVPGFSRDYYTLAEVATAAEDQEVYAFRKLVDHIKKRDFDIFIFFDADRFGRKSSLVHEVIGRIVDDCKARLYSLKDGMIDAEGAGIYKTLKAMEAENHVRKLKEYRKRGMERRAERGLSVSSVTPLFHKLIRDSAGNEVGVVLNEDLRLLWDDLYTVLVDQHEPYDTIEVVLATMGHTRPDGRPYPHRYMYNLLANPAFWGHRAMYYARKIHFRKEGYRRWCWDETIEPPEGAIVHRNILPAVYTGEQAERVKAEMLRRVLVVAGRGHSNTSYRFSQVVFCDECGKRMAVTQSKKVYLYLRCNTAHHVQQLGDCTQKGYLSFPYLQELLTDAIVRRMRGEGDSLLDTASSVATPAKSDDTALLIGKLTSQIGVLIREQSAAPDAAQDYYRQEIATLSRKIETLTHRTLSAEKTNQKRELIAARQQYAYSQVEAIGIEAFWELPDPQINQLLLDMLGEWRLVARDKVIIGKTTDWKQHSR